MVDAISALHQVFEAGDFGRETDTPEATLRQRRGLMIAQLCHWPDRDAAFARSVDEILALPVPAVGRASSGDAVALLAIGPETYWVVAETGATGLLATLRARLDSDTATVAELSQARCALRLSGPAARQVLAKGLPLDLHPRVLPIAGVAGSAVHGIDVVLHRSGEQAFDLYVLRSYAVSFWAWLTDSAAAFGYRVAAD